MQEKNKQELVLMKVFDNEPFEDLKMIFNFVFRKYVELGLSKKELGKYSLATIIFIGLFMGFFALSDAILSVVRMVIK